MRKGERGIVVFLLLLLLNKGKRKRGIKNLQGINKMAQVVLGLKKMFSSFELLLVLGVDDVIRDQFPCIDWGSWLRSGKKEGH